MSEIGSSAGAVGLDAVLRAVDEWIAQRLVPAPRADGVVASVDLLDADDLLARPVTVPPTDLCVLAGVTELEAADWLHGLAGQEPGRRPLVVLTRLAAPLPRLEQAARAAAVGLVLLQPRARWPAVMTSIRRVLDDAEALEPSARATAWASIDVDLSGLAQTVAALTRGMVSIEDDRSRMLAYSASDEAADELRRLSILGRVGPADYLERLHSSGVFEQLQRSDDVIEVPADESLGIRRRLVVSIRALGEREGKGRRGAHAPSLGAIWLQEGQDPLAPDAEAVLRGASAVAARLVTRAINAPSNEAVQIERLLGTRGGGVDVVSLAAALSLPTSGPAVVVGFAPVGQQSGPALPGSTLNPTPSSVTSSGLRSEGGSAISAATGSALGWNSSVPPALTTTTDESARIGSDVASALRLHASAFSRESLVTSIGARVYVLIPRVRSLRAVTSWSGQVIERLASRGGAGLRAAVAAPVSHLSDVAAARAEVDRVLDATTGDRRVTTLADSRTPVLLGEVMDLLATHPELADPRVQALLDHDQQHGSSVRMTLEAYLSHFGDVRSAAAQLHVHPNTLRYRVKRAEAILDIDLDDPSGRLLVELQLAMLRRARR